MASGIYKVTWGGPGNIVWEKLADSSQKLESANHVISISSSIAAVSSTLAAGLSLVSVIQNTMILSKISGLQKDVVNLKARFDLLFMDRSLDYFEKAHGNRLGIDINIAEALKQDCLNALTQMVQDKTLAAPAFLRHRSLATTEAVRQFNQLLYAVLHGGAINALERVAVLAWIKQVPSLVGVSPDGGYVAQSDLLLLWREELVRRETIKKGGSLVDRFSTKDQSVIDEACSEGNFERCFEVLGLLREVEAYIRYSEILSSRAISGAKGMSELVFAVKD